MQKPSSSSQRSRTKADPRELELIRQLRRLMRNRTNPDSLRCFLSELNDVITTALIRQGLDKIELQRVRDAANHDA